ncbi:MAG TPA: DNA polymerase IV [Gemmatimonadales bacterium]|nr:DNA polymerase IV [Gemmatimonadales bacterium]
MNARRVLLADADAFYVSVARLVDPAGAGRAPLLIVGGSAEQRGVVTSASYEARAYGVHSAMPMARAVRLCPKATVVPVPWEACGEKSREIRRVLERFTPAVEQASSDEFYLDMSGTEQLYHGESLTETGRRIREAVLAETALSVSIGGGTSRLIAKVAAGVAKPPGDGVHVVAPGTEEAFLRRFTLADLPGIGPKAADRLRQAGLRTVEDVLPHDRPTLAARLGERQADWLYARVRGIDHTPVEPRAEARSISRDGTFARDLDADDDLARELLALAARAAGDLREAGLLARTVTVKLRDWDFTTRQAGRTLPEAVLSDRVIGDVARALLAKLRAARRVPARLLGVALSGLVREDAERQLSLLPEGDGRLETERDRTITRVLDDVRERFGPDALRRGAAG